MSAVLLPFESTGQVDWPSFVAQVERTVTAGLTPAVNMDTGYVNLLDSDTKLRVLVETEKAAQGSDFIAGAYIADQPGDGFDRDGYLDAIEQILSHGGTPILFQSYGLAHGDPDTVVKNYQALAAHCNRFLAFELGTMFAPFGKIYELEVYRELMKIPQCVGAKHSSLSRKLEWERLALRDRERDDFMVLTGNDLAIDMVMYGSDYLLGLSTFAPDLFGKRDQMWLNGDPAFYELNDALQYLGCLAFRAPTPAYKHSAAMFLKQRGWLNTNLTHPDSPRRPESDGDILLEIGRRLGIDMKKD